MKVLHKIFTISSLLIAMLIVSENTYSQSRGDVFNTIAKYIQKGDYEKLAIWFGNSIEIEMIGEQMSCSNSQAKFIMKDFFANHTPKKFQILHKSGNPQMRYAIGQLQCSGENFRIILLVKNKVDSSVIVRIRIEKE